MDPTQQKGPLLLAQRQGIIVNAFAKEYQEWLPSAKVGDVVILHGVLVGPPFFLTPIVVNIEKTELFNGKVTITGRKDRMQWVLYTTAGEFAHPRGSAPFEAGLGPGGTGLVHTPFWDVKEYESAALSTYCVHLSDWWIALDEKRKADMGTMHQIGGGDPSASQSSGFKRSHQLACDMHPKMQPSGYCDCTVEVRVIVAQRLAETYALPL